MSSIDLDALYDSFRDGLPAELRAPATALASKLGLAPDRDIPWSAVFKHEVTLQAPGLFAEGMRSVTTFEVERAVLAHLLSVVEAFGADRVADQQAEETPELRRVLAHLRDARDAALQSVGGPLLRDIVGEADRRTRTGISAEHAVLSRGEPTLFRTYEEISTDKQAVGFPATVALAMRAGWDADRLETVRLTLTGVSLGLQFHDDVVDWEEDAARGGAWMVLLARRVADERRPPDTLHGLVFASGVLSDVLERAAERYTEAATGADALDARRLAGWCRERASEALEHAAGERRSPGYVARLRKLDAWKAEVLG